MIDQAQKPSWQQISLPLNIFERMWCFSVPIGGQVAVVANDGIYSFDLLNPGSLDADREHPQGGDLLDHTNHSMLYHGNLYHMLGVGGGDPILQSQYGETLLLDRKRERFTVSSLQGDTLYSHTFEDFSGDWSFVTFSSDCQFIVLGMPYDLYAFSRAGHLKR